MDINLIDHLDANSIVLNLKAKSKKNIISVILDHLISAKKIKSENKKDILKVLMQREEMGSTAIGGSIALPHARLGYMKKLVICFAISHDGVDFDALDQDKVCVVVLLLSNNREAGLHLKMLAFLARMLRDRYFVQQLKNAKSVEEALIFIQKKHLVQ
ncbi:MAG: PTS sugar transporter subunit IIA [Candidatus Omnitrophota bacterium]